MAQELPSFSLLKREMKNSKGWQIIWQSLKAHFNTNIIFEDSLYAKG